MIRTTAMLLEEFRDYPNPSRIIRNEILRNKLIPVKRGVYETNAAVSGHLLASVIFSPSYLSLHYALAHHGLIPKAVSEYTSVTCRGIKKKDYTNSFGKYSYLGVPVDAFHFGYETIEEDDYSYSIACPEKALCDLIYSTPLLHSMHRTELFLTKSLCIEPSRLKQLDSSIFSGICDKYHSANVRLLTEFIQKLN